MKKHGPPAKKQAFFQRHIVEVTLTDFDQTERRVPSTVASPVAVLFPLALVLETGAKGRVLGSGTGAGGSSDAFTGEAGAEEVGSDDSMGTSAMPCSQEKGCWNTTDCPQQGRS